MLATLLVSNTNYAIETKKIIEGPIFNTHYIKVPDQLKPQVAPVPLKEEAPRPTTVQARVTGYAPFDNKSGICADENPEVTSTGVRPGTKYAAVDPRRIPYGTEIEVPGYGLVIAADTGGALRSSKDLAIDLYFDTYEAAMAWGVQYLDVEIKEGE